MRICGPRGIPNSIVILNKNMAKLPWLARLTIITPFEQPGGDW